MLSLNNKKYLKSLSIKKYRQEEKKVVPIKSDPKKYVSGRVNVPFLR